MRLGTAISLVLVALMALACTATPAPTPTPSGPMYSKAEAMAVLKEHLQTKIFPGEPYPCLLVIEDNIRNPNSVTWDTSYNSYQRLWEVTATSNNYAAVLVESMFKTPEPTSMWAPFGATAVPQPTLPRPKRYSWSVYERTGSIVATGDDPVNQMC